MNFLAGDYEFTVGSDEGFRLYVDDVLVSSVWSNRTFAETTVIVPVTAGAHTVKLEYYEATGVARMQFTMVRLQ